MGARLQMIETSRRAFLRVLGSAPLFGLASDEPGPAAKSTAIATQSVPLRRTSDARKLSRVRYHNAESFFAPIERRFLSRGNDQLYYVGISLQLALSAHLLDVGFDDTWCARNIGLHVDRSLALANATGLDRDDPDLKRLAEFISPYGRWRNAVLSDPTERCPFSYEDIRGLTRDLLERVREVTGHSRPRKLR
jgi:hypothetical protein